MAVKTWVAVWVGRMVGWLSRTMGRGGSSLPGMVSRRIDPGVLTALAQHLSWGAILLSGTNGKTTTAAVVRQILLQGQQRVVTNRAGANLIEGLTAAFVQYERWRVWPRASLALLETDEATMPRAGQEIRPRMVVVTNFFRDQLDRYGELSTTVRYVARGLEWVRDDGWLVLNADDPQVAGLAGNKRSTVFYGLELPAAWPGDEGERGDARFCPRCGTALEYTRRYYAHVGHYTCPHCRWNRPRPSVRVVEWSPDTGRVMVDTDQDRLVIPWHLPGIYNLYNLAAGIATALAAEVSPEVIRAALANFKPAFGRMEHLTVGSMRWWLALVKNPTGFNQVLAAIAQERGHAFSVLVAINDHYADGRDVSWLWDVDLERWIQPIQAQHWYVTGTRAYDMAVRLKYAGIPPDQLSVDDQIERCLDRLRHEQPIDTLYVLPTYTALLKIRQQLTRWGVAEHFREG
ncbi:MAG: MurT ligase domain-containing protein [Firmicutes bacterium]|nr:MurT ligase domain-containing protein [Bacillota bacterium]